MAESLPSFYHVRTERNDEAEWNAIAVYVIYRNPVMLALQIYFLWPVLITFFDHTDVLKQHPHLMIPLVLEVTLPLWVAFSCQLFLRLERPLKHEPLQREHVLFLKDRITSNLLPAALSYDDIRGIYETKKYFIIYGSAFRFLVLDKEGFLAGTAEDFPAYILCKSGYTPRYRFLFPPWLRLPSKKM